MSQEEIKDTEITEVETNEEASTQQEEQDVSVSEIKRRVAELEKKHKREVEQIKADHLAELERVRNESTLTGKALEEWRQKEAEKEKQDLLDKIAALESREKEREIKDTAIALLNEKSLPVSDTILALVVKEDEKKTIEAIDNIHALFLSQKQEYAKSYAPNTSGGVGEKTAPRSRSEILNSAKITKF